MDTFLAAQQGQVNLRLYKQKAHLIGNATVQVADLGFAKKLGGEEALTCTQLGTPLYMAPEIFAGKAYSHKVDVWALGCVFYQMLTGKTPFTGMDKKDLIKNLKQGDWEVPQSIRLSSHGLDFLNSCL